MTEPRKRGRPATDHATPGAERQRRYIERLKAQAAPPAPDPDLSHQLALAQAEMRRLNQEGDRLFLKVGQLTRNNDARESKILRLCKQLDAATKARDAAIAETVEAKSALAVAREEIKQLERELKRMKR